MSDIDVAATPPTGGIDHHVSVDPAVPTEPRAAADGGPDMVQLLTPEGERVAHAEYDAVIDALSNDDLRGLYRQGRGYGSGAAWLAQRWPREFPSPPAPAPL